jgi:hypothetical protein
MKKIKERPKPKKLREKFCEKYIRFRKFFTTRVLVICFIVLALVLLFFYAEGVIYTQNYEWYPGDCGQFVIWEAACWGEVDEACTYEWLRNISLRDNPFSVMTGPLTLRQSLEEFDVPLAFYNNFSAEQIREKIDEGKSVIVVMDVSADEGYQVLHHYLFVYDYSGYNETLEGFYFTDSYYFDWNWSEPVYWNISEFERHRPEIFETKSFIGKIEEKIGMNRLAFVVGEEGNFGTNKKMFFVFRLQNYAEKLLAFLGRVVIFISPRI